MKKLLIFMLIAVFAASMLFVGVSCKEEAAEEETMAEEETAEEEEAAEEEPAEEEATEEVEEEAEEDSRYGGELVLGTIGEPEHLDLGLIGWTTLHYIADGINGYLCYISEGELKLDLLESYSYTDDVTIECVLRQDAVFHNGRGVVAEDVKNSIERALYDPESTRGGLIGVDIETEVIDDYNFILKLSAPKPELLTLISVIPIIPIEALDDTGYMKDNPVGCGPFKFSSWERGSKIVLERFDNWYEKDENGDQLPYLDKLVFVFPADNAARMAGMLSGEIDFTLGASLDNVQAAMNGQLEGIKADPGGDDSVTREDLHFNFTRELWQNVKLRQAIAWAIDRQQINDLAWSGLMEPRCTFVAPEFKDYYKAEWDMYLEQDQELAKQLLAEAGYPDGEGLPNLEFVVSNDAPNPEEAQIIQDQLSQVGIKVNVTLMDQASWQTVVPADKDFDLTLSGAAHPPLERTVTNMYTASTGNGNFGGFSNEELDALCAEFTAANDGPEAIELFQQIWDWRLENAAPQIVLLSQKDFCLLSEKVQGWDGKKGLEWFFHTMWISE